MSDCIFCNIIQGQIPSVKVYEDDDVVAFLDISQVTPGHTLLVPKVHVADIFDYDADLAARVFSKVPLIARSLRQAFPEMKGLNIANNNGKLAYQSVFHSHIHFVPRYTDHDGLSMTWADNSKLTSAEDLTQRGAKIRQAVEVLS